MESPFILDHGQKGSTADLAGGLTVQFAPYPPSNVFMVILSMYIFIYTYIYVDGMSPGWESNSMFVGGRVCSTDLFHSVPFMWRKESVVFRASRADSGMWHSELHERLAISDGAADKAEDKAKAETHQAPVGFVGWLRRLFQT